VNEEIRARAEALLGHSFSNPALLQEALTHSSLADCRAHSNERLEFLGDAVLDLIICEELFRRFPQFQEGEMTKVKSAVVSRRTCCDVAMELGLAELLQIGKGIGARASIPPSLIANLYESIIGALYLDAGFEHVKQFVLRSMRPRIEACAANGHQENYKAMLQQHVQRDFGAAPVYEILDEKGPDHSKCFEVCVAVGGRRFASAWGPNKKTAEQKAALLALEELGLVDAREVDDAIHEITAAE
jgi:ribonuclease-3